MVDIHNLGEYTSLSDVWKLFPNGGGYGDYILLNGVRYDWKETSNSWTESSITEYPSRPAEIITHDVQVLGDLDVTDNLQIGPYIKGQSGAQIDKFGNGELRTLSIDQLLVKDGTDYIPLAELIQQFKTELPPNWAEYNEITVLNEARVLIFNPYSNEKYYVTYESLRKSIISGIESGTGEPITLDIISSDEPALLTENNVLSSLRTLVEIERLINEKGGQKFLSKISPDTAQGLIKFIAGIETKDFISGMLTGKGGKIDADGNAELQSLIVRSFLEVPELRHNRETVIGMEMTIGDSGIIESVTTTADPDVFILKMKLEDGELITFWEHDILKGIFNHGNGFKTSWFRVNSIDQASETINITMASALSISTGTNFPPKPFMHIAHRGNFVHAERQTVIYLTAYERKIIVLSGVDNYEGGIISAQLGAPTGLENILPDTLPINKNDSYLYVRGLLAQDILRINYKGAIAKDIIDRGQWSLETAQSDEPYLSTATEQHEAWIGLNKYRCIVNATIEVPSIGSTDWILILGIGDQIDEVENKIPISWELQPVSDKGVNAFNYDSSGIMNSLIYSVRFLRSGIDVTDIMNLSTNSLYNFERRNTFGVDDNGASDESWNIAHSGAKTVTLTNSDIYGVGEIIVAFDEALVEAEYQILK